MDAHTVVDAWEVGPFDGGFDGIHDLRSQGFSGVVEAGATALFLREGEPLAIVADLEGDPRSADVDAFEGATGQRREAPYPAAATVAAMLATDGEVRGRYFTDNTPLSDVHETLTEGGFTGYVELSENVMSGDYYVVYVDGEADHVGFVGGSNELITGEEARRRAHDEVGIYRVVAVTLPSIDIPAAERTSEGTGSAGGGVDLGDADDVGEDPPEAGSDASTPTRGDAESGTDADVDRDGRSASASATTTASSDDSSPGSGPGPEDISRSEFEIDLDLGPDSEGESDDEAEEGPGSDPDAGPASEPEPDLESEPEGQAAPESGSDSTSESNSESGSGAVAEPGAGGERAAGSDSDAATGPASAAGQGSGNDADEVSAPGATPDSKAESDGSAPATEEDLDLEIDVQDEGTDAGESRSSTSPRRPLNSGGGSSGGTGVASSRDTGDTSSSGTGNASFSDPGDASSGRATMEDVTTRMIPSLDPTKSNRDRSRSGGQGISGQGAGRRSAGHDATSDASGRRDATAERASDSDGDSGRRLVSVQEEYESRIEDIREEYEQRVEELRSKLAELRDERDRLKERVATLEARTGADKEGRALSPAEALAGTSLFVRESTRGAATLEDAHAGEVDRDTLAGNLRLEYHTTFEDEGATVDGEAFEDWLRSSPGYEFAEWLISVLLFEIQSTGSAGEMQHLYDALPQIDRIAFADAVAVEEDAGGDREIEFDVVVRNQMGDPLVVANIDVGRDPTRADAIEPLIRDASDVCEAKASLAGAFAVTSSYFEPDALDVAREATSGSLLSREKYRSYVKLARKNGYHLCLVESRADSFHLALPEL